MRIFYKFFCTKSSKITLELLRNSSTIFRSNHQRCFIQKVVFEKFAIFTGKQLWWSLFLKKNADLWVCNFIKNRLKRKCFPVKFAKFLRTPFLQNTSVAKTNQKKQRYSEKRYTLWMFLLKHNEAKKWKEL